MTLIKPSDAVIPFSLFFIFFVIFAVRKLAYELYLRFPNASRICEFGWKREFKFYWASRADFSIFDLARLYVLWIMLRFDKYLPVIDCERQAAKAQYFHASGRYRGMGSWHFRRVNPKAWPVLLMRGFAAFLFPALSNPRNQIIEQPKSKTASQKHGNICLP